MHPLVLYLATTDVLRGDRAAAEQERGLGYAPVDALPLDGSAPESRVRRLAAILRRPVMWPRRSEAQPRRAPLPR